MNAKEFTDAWGQYTSGSQLTEEEILAMERLMESDAVMRAEVSEDHQLHRMLQSLGTIHESQHEFVSGVMEACTGVDNPVAPLLDRKAESGNRRRWKLISIVCIACIVGIGAIAGVSHVGSVVLTELGDARAEASQAMQLAAQAREQAERAEQLSTQRTRESGQENDNGSDPAPEPQEPVIVARTVAVITGDTPCVWRGDVVGKEIDAGEYELISGDAVLRMAGGSIVSVQSPVRFTLHHSTHMTLHEGDIEVQVVPEDVGFRISTANSRIIDLGTAFRVSATEGRTKVQLDTGEVVVMPWQSGRSQSRHHLRVGEYEEIGVFKSIDGLLAHYTSGPSGFSGSIKLDDTSFELTSMERYNHVLDSISTSLRSDPASTKAAWLRARKVLPRVSGSVKFSDKELAFDNLDSILKIEEEFLRATDVRKALEEMSVAGFVSVAGRQHQFQSREEYEQFRARVLEPLGALGIQSLMERQREQDLETNPFRP